MKGLVRFGSQGHAQAAQILAETLNPAWLQAVTLVPVPPSACKEDEAHDDRMLQVLRALGSRVLV